MPDRPIRIAILDDGVHPKACPLAGSFLVDDELNFTPLEQDTVSSDSHGSMCARIIARYTDLDKVDVYSIQIICGDTWRGNIGRILKAFELCVSLDIRLIHLSVGTYIFEDFALLEDAVQNLNDTNRILVASTGNRGTVTYPAYLPGVFGVQYHPELADGEYVYYHDPFTRIHLQASAKHNLIIEGQEIETQLSNSYATPLITAKILSYLKVNANLEQNEITHLLKENALHHTSVKKNEPNHGALVELPVVVLSGFSIDRLHCLLELLMNRLREDDYNARAASNLPGIRPWDETILPETAELDHFIARMALYFHCEIVLLGLVSYIPPDRCTNVSLWIYGDKSNYYPTTDILADGQVLCVNEQSDSKVYERMITMLT